LVWRPFEAGAPPAARPSPDSEEAARLATSRTIAIRPDSLLARKLKVVQARQEDVRAPVLTVTGSIVARPGPGRGSAETRWDFSIPELATAYADWLKARAEVPFTEKQLVKIRALATARAEYHNENVKRLEKLVELGTDAAKDLAAAKAEKLKE